MSLSKELKVLKDFYCEKRCVLSVYLNTNPGDPQQLNGGWKIHLKSGFKRIDEYLTASEDAEELKAFHALKKKVTEEIESNQNNLSKSVVIFAAVEPELWSVHYVQVPVKTSFHWENQPMTEELSYMYKAYPEAGIILPSSGEVRVLDTAMGSVKSDSTYDYDTHTGKWNKRELDATSPKQETGSTIKPTFESRPQNNIKGFYKEMDKVVASLKKAHGWREIHVSGETELANAFAEILREKPASCIYKNLNNSKANDVIHQVFEK